MRKNRFQPFLDKLEFRISPSIVSINHIIALAINGEGDPIPKPEPPPKGGFPTGKGPIVFPAIKPLSPKGPGS